MQIEQICAGRSSPEEHEQEMQSHLEAWVKSHLHFSRNHLLTLAHAPCILEPSISNSELFRVLPMVCISRSKEVYGLERAVGGNIGNTG